VCVCLCVCVCVCVCLCVCVCVWVCVCVCVCVCLCVCVCVCVYVCVSVSVNHTYVYTCILCVRVCMRVCVCHTEKENSVPATSQKQRAWILKCSHPARMMWVIHVFVWERMVWQRERERVYHTIPAKKGERVITREFCLIILSRNSLSYFLRLL